MSIAPLPLHVQGDTTVDMNLFTERLRRQQYRQDLHDRKYHTDIYVLPKAKRLTHLVLHHCKYVADLYAIMIKPGFEGHMHRNADVREVFTRRALDGLIVSLSIANICGYTIPGSIATTPWTDIQARNVMIAAIGKMAKTIEDIDHMGQTNPLGELWSRGMDLFSVYTHCLRLVGIPFWEMVDSIHDRLLAVESKHIWHNNYLDEIDHLMEEYDSERIING